MFKFLKTAAIAAIAITGFASDALADRAIKTTPDGWTLLITTDMQRCYIGKKYNHDTTITMAINPVTKNVFFTFSNPTMMNDTRMVNRRYSIRLVVDNFEPWVGNLTAFSVDDAGVPFPAFGATLPVQFLENFAMGSAMSIFVNGERLSTIGLGGTYNAAMELIKCQTSISI